MDARKQGLAQRLEQHALTTRFGEFMVTGYTCGAKEQAVMALTGGRAPKRLRIQFGCMFGMAFGSVDCDCGRQIERAFEIIGEDDGGILLYFRDHEAHGLGLDAKLRLMKEEKTRGIGPGEAMKSLGFNQSAIDVMWVVPSILNDLDLRGPFTLLGENRTKIAQLERHGVKIAAVEPLQIPLAGLSSFARAELAENKDTSERIATSKVGGTDPNVWISPKRGRTGNHWRIVPK